MQCGLQKTGRKTRKKSSENNFFVRVNIDIFFKQITPLERLKYEIKSIQFLQQQSVTHLPNEMGAKLEVSFGSYCVYLHTQFMTTFFTLCVQEVKMVYKLTFGV